MTCSAIAETVTLHIPFRVVKRGGRKEMMHWPGGTQAQRKTDNTLFEASACAFRWKRMLEPRRFTTIAELAERQDRLLLRDPRLTLLAPDIVEAIFYETQGPEVTLARILERFLPGYFGKP